MPSYRQIHTKIWKDGWFLDLPSDHKLLFIYLFSNERANLTGMYELPLKVICFETDLDPDTVVAGLQKFAAEGKALYENGWLWVRSLLHYNALNLTSEKIQTHIRTTLAEIPDIPLKAQLIAYYRNILPQDTLSIPLDTLSIPIPTEHEHDLEHDLEQEQEHEQDTDSYAASAAPDTPAPATNADYQEIRQVWIALFPDKPKPRENNQTLQGKAKTRMQSTHFRENWHDALVRASGSKFLGTGSFFTLGWFLKNDDHYERCLDGTYDDKAPLARGSPIPEPKGFPAIRRAMEREGMIDDRQAEYDQGVGLPGRTLPEV